MNEQIKSPSRAATRKYHGGEKSFRGGGVNVGLLYVWRKAKIYSI